MLVGMMLGGCAVAPRFTSQESAPAVRRADGKASSPSGRAITLYEGIASYYADQYHGRKTSSGEVYDMNALTAAHREWPFGTRVRVTNLENGRDVTVRINDRGPFKEERIIDLSLAAAKQIGLIASGTVRVRIEVLEWGP